MADDDKKKPLPAPEEPPVKPKPAPTDVPSAGRPHMVADSDDSKKRKTKRIDE